MITMNDVRSKEFQMKALTNLVDHAIREMRAASETLKAERAKERSIMLEWAEAQCQQATSYADGVFAAVSAAGYGICTDSNGNTHLEVI